MNYISSSQDVKEYLDSFTNYEREINFTYSPSTFDLNRVKTILSNLGNPHRAIKTIHIAGTKGKGSTAYLVSSILRAAGYKVGLYTSPHIVYFTERIRILEGESGRLISDEEVSDIVDILKPIIDKTQADAKFGNLTYFEVLTCLCFYFFAKEKVDYAVIEVGMGGRLDATNVITPLVSAITSISFDHTKELGDTLALIAKEKAGIIKDNTPVVVSMQQEEVKKVIRDVCRDKKSVTYEFGRDFHVKIKQVDNKESIFDVSTGKEKYDDLHLSLLGEHQIINAAVSIEITEILKSTGINIPRESVYKAFRNASFIGRLEVIKEEPTIILDGAHNEASAFCLKDAITKLFNYEKLYLVLGMSKNKDIKAFADVLCPVAYEVILTKADSPRAADPVKLTEEELISYSEKTICLPDVEQTLKYVLLRATPKDLICCTGSFYILAEVKLFFEDIYNY